MTKKVLLVETDPQLMTQFVAALRGAGHEVITATDGEEGWSMYQQYSPDAVITALRMPNLDGIGLLRRIRGKMNNTPVYLLATESGRDSEPEAHSLGVTAVAYMPIQDLTLLSRWVAG